MQFPEEDTAIDETTSLVRSRRPTHSILDAPLGSFKGPNSLHNFASSFTRAQSFAASKIDNDIRKKRSFFYNDNNDQHDSVVEDELFDPELMVPSARGERLSVVLHDVIHKNLILSGTDLNMSTNNDVFYQDDIINALNLSKSRKNSTYTGGAMPIHISKRKSFPSPSFSSIRSSISMATTASRFNLTKIEDKEGNIVTVLEGQSTAPQTIFNSINVLIGVGLLALPVGILKAGWVIGVPLLACCGMTTYWSATLLSKAMDTDKTIMTYADLGYAAYGSMAKLFISLIFSMDLLGAGVSLIVLFSDSLYALLGDEVVWTKTKFKLISFFVLTPFTFLPLPILSIFSLFGIISTISITLLVLVCGFLKPDSPGSLISIMPTNMWPQSIPDLLLAIGILMAPFGGHAIFPNLKSDMRHPHKFTGTLSTTYSITLVTDLSMGILGFLMFGAYCNNEITNNLLLTSGYPVWCYPLLSGLICLIPLAKTPLNAKPIISTLDILFSFDKLSGNSFRRFINSFGKLVIRIGVNAVFVGLAILFPEFDRVIGILGSSICFLVCIILPCLFYLKLCNNTVQAFEKAIVSIVISISIILAFIGTWAVLNF